MTAEPAIADLIGRVDRRHRQHGVRGGQIAGLRHGLSRVGIEAAITHPALYAGVPRAIDALPTAREAWGEA